MEYLKALYQKYKKDKKFLEIYLDKLASFDRIKAKKEILRLKLPLEVIRKISIKHRMNEITFLVSKKMGISHQTVPIILNEVTRDVANVDFDNLSKNLNRLEVSLGSIELEEHLFDVNNHSQSPLILLLETNPEHGHPPTANRGVPGDKKKE